MLFNIFLNTFRIEQTLTWSGKLFYNTLHLYSWTVHKTIEYLTLGLLFSFKISITGGKQQLFWPTVYSFHLILWYTPEEQCLFQASFFSGGGGGIPPFPKKLTIPQTAAKLCAINIFFFGRGKRITDISRKLSFNGQWTQKIICH